MSLFKKFVKTDNINNVFSSYDISEKTATLKSNLLYVNSDTIIFITDPSVGNYIYTKGSLFGGIDSNGVASGEMDYDYINDNFISREEFTEFVESGNFSGSENIIDTSNLLEKSSFEEYVADVSNNYARKTDLDEFINDASVQNYVLNVSNYVSENYITNSSLNQIIIDTSSYIANNYVTKSEFEEHVENCGSSEDIIKEDSLDEFTIYNTRLMSFPSNSEELSNYSSIVDLDNIDTNYIYDGNFSSLMELFMSETILTDIETAYENNPDLGTFLLDLVSYISQNSEMAESPDYILACIANESIIDPLDLSSLSEIDGYKLMIKAIEKISPLYTLSHKILYNIYGNLYFPIYASNIFIFIEVDKDTLQPLRAFMIGHNNEDGTTLMNDNDELYINMYTEDDNRTILTFETLPDIDDLNSANLNSDIYLLLGKSLTSGLYKENGKSEWDKDKVIYDTMCFPFDIASPLKSPSRNLNDDSNTYLSYINLKYGVDQILESMEISQTIQSYLLNNPGVTLFTNRHVFASEDGQYAIAPMDVMFNMMKIIDETILDSDEYRLGSYVFFPKAKNEYWIFTNTVRLTYIEEYSKIDISLPIYVVNIEKNVITRGSFDYNYYFNDDEFVDLSSDGFVNKLEQYKKSVPSTSDIEDELSDLDEITRTFTKMFIINKSALANTSAEISAIKGDIDTLAEFINKQHVDIEKTNSMVLDFIEKLSNVELVLSKKINNLSNKIDFQNYLMHTIVSIDSSTSHNSTPEIMAALRIPAELNITIASENTMRLYIHDSMALYAVGMISLEETAALLNFSSTVLCLSNMIYTAIPNGSTFDFLLNALYSINPGTLCGRMETNDTYLLRLDVFINPYAHIFLKRFNLSQDAWTHWYYYLPGHNISYEYEGSLTPTAYNQGYDLTKNYILTNFEIPTIGDLNEAEVDINNVYDELSNPNLYSAFIDGCDGAKAYGYGFTAGITSRDVDNPYEENEVVLHNEYNKGLEAAMSEYMYVYRRGGGDYNPDATISNPYDANTLQYNIYAFGYECARQYHEGYSDGYDVGYNNYTYNVSIDENIFAEYAYKEGYDAGYADGLYLLLSEQSNNENPAE